MNIADLVKEITKGRGFVVLPNLISFSQAAEARNLIMELAAQDKQQGKLVIQGKKERLYGLLYRGDVFADLVQNPTVLSVVKTIIEGEPILGGFSAHILHPGAIPMGMHVDYPYWAMPAPFPKYPILEVQIIWMLEDFTANNGAPVFAAGTQKLAKQPEKRQFKIRARKITGAAGSVVISHGLCWHNTSENNSDRPRVSLLGNYTPQYVHPLENNLFAHQPEAMKNASPELKKLLRHTWMPKSDPMYDMKSLN
ncbi:MAG: phytanoyl-CoA dioxygenase family protein [Cyanobacteria bacterium J06621_8]